MNERALWTEVHGLLFGVFFLLAAYALLLDALRAFRHLPLQEELPWWERLYLAAAAVCGWLAVITGTFIVYPWYRAPMAAGDDLRMHPRALLLAHAQTAPLHSLGMEWKEHIALLAPLAFTAAAILWTRHRPVLREEPLLRRRVLIFTAVALFATGVAGLTGAMLNKSAPVESSFSPLQESR
jgi:hypothetical protein